MFIDCYLCSGALAIHVIADREEGLVPELILVNYILQTATWLQHQRTSTVATTATFGL